MNYHVVTLAGRNPSRMVIKTKEPSIDSARAIQAYNMVHGTRLELSDESIGKLEAFVDPPEGEDSLTVLDRLPDGWSFYREPGHVLPVLLVRVPSEARHTPLAAMVSVPSYMIDRDCTGAAARRFLAQIVREGYAEGMFNCVAKKVDEVDYTDLVRLPAPFLARYGVKIEELDAYLAIQAGMDESVIRSTYGDVEASVRDLIEFEKATSRVYPFAVEDPTDDQIRAIAEACGTAPDTDSIYDVCERVLGKAPGL